MKNILNKKLHIHIKIRERHHPVNVGLIFLVVLSSLATWFLTEYFVFQLDNMNKDFFGTRPIVQAALEEGAPMPDINEIASMIDLSLVDGGLNMGDGNNALSNPDDGASKISTSSTENGIEVKNLFDGKSNQSNENKTKLEIYKAYFGGSKDSDSDGLPDDKEISIYKTDPNKADTDGDSYTDGEEVYNSYSPLVKGGSIDKNLAIKLKGKIVLQSQEHGEAWYIYPKDMKRYYLGRPQDAFSVMRNLGLGITDKDLVKIPKNTDSWTDKTGIADRLAGQIVLQVEKNGEAYYINPTDKKRYYLGRPNDAFDIMRNLGLGIAFNDLVRLEK